MWPKKPGAYIPYNSGSPNSPDQDREQWLREKNAYLQKHSNTSGDDPIMQQRIQTLQTMEFREFLAIYEGAQELGVPEGYSGDSIYVGHVGIIEIDASNTAWVIEALLKEGVIRKKYEDWVSERADEAIWLGRLKEYDAESRAKVVTEARRHLKKPYDFWNFNLNDESGFYCSKLAWLSIFRSLGLAIDGDPDPERVIWFSPKQFLYLPTIDRIHDPGPYAHL